VHFIGVRRDELRAALGGAPVHEHDVDRDAMKPRRELRLTAEVFQAAMNLQKNFLDDVFELGARADHSKHQARYFGAVTKEELSKSFAIPPLAARDHFIWFEHSIEANPGARFMPEQNAGDRNVHLSLWCEPAYGHSKP
jgi:hypothetical protein